MKEISNEETMLVRLFAFETDTRSSLARRICVGRVDAESDGIGEGINRVKA